MPFSTSCSFAIRATTTSTFEQVTESTPDATVHQASPVPLTASTVQSTDADKFLNRQLNWVVTTGTSGVGKGTLLEKVAKSGHIVIPEVARHILAKRDQEGTPRFEGLQESIVAVQSRWQQDVSETLLTNPSALPQLLTNIAAVGIIENIANRSAQAAKKNPSLTTSDLEVAGQLALHLPRMRPLENGLCMAPTSNSVAQAVINKLSLSPALSKYLGLEPDTTGAKLYVQIVNQAQAQGEEWHQAFTQLPLEQQKTVFSDRGFLDPVAFFGDRSVVAAANLSLREDRRKASDSVGAQESSVGWSTRVIMDAAARFHNIKVLLVEPHVISDAGLKALQDAQRQSSPAQIRQQHENLRQAYAAFNPVSVTGVDIDGNPVSPDKRAQQALSIAHNFAKPAFMRPTAASAARKK